MNARIETASTLAIPTGASRLKALTWSWNPLVWWAALSYRLAIGSTGSPVWVIFVRAPRVIIAHLVLVATSEFGLSLDKRLRSLLRVFSSRVNNCLYCDDLESYVALKHRTLTREDLDALPTYRDSQRFSERERAALRYVEAINTSRTADDETFAALRRHYSEREIVEITWLNAVGNYLNLQAKPLGLTAEGYCALPQR